jgi:hypothetical protein
MEAVGFIAGWAALFLLVLTSSCFDPQYGAGGFSCATGLCPEGYRCLSEGELRVCRPEGYRRDAASDAAPADRLRDTSQPERRSDLPPRDHSSERRPDGLPCTPTSYHQDTDGDKYGDPSRTVSACAPPPGYVTNGEDCDDQDRIAYPGQTAFQSAATQGTHTFDYNCDQVEEREHPLLASCTASGADCTGEGWLGTVPACGQSGTFATCFKQSGMSGCNQSTALLVQRCR